MKQLLLLVGLRLCGATATQPRLKLGKQTINGAKAVQAASDVATAVLSDADIARMSHESVEWMDAHNPIDEGEYDARMKELADKYVADHQ